MHRFARRTTMALFLAASLISVAVAHPTSRSATQPATAPAESAELRQQLDAIDAKAGAIRDLTAHFVQKKYSPLLNDPITTDGEVFSRGASVLWRSAKPEPVRTRVTRDRLQIYYANGNVIEDYPVRGKLGTLAASPLPRLASLREQFTLSRDAGDDLPSPEGVGATIAVRLEPRDAEVKQYVDHVRVRLDPARGLLVAFELVDPDGEQTVITFSDIRTDTDFADSELQLNPRPGARTVAPLGEAAK